MLPELDRLIHYLENFGEGTSRVTHTRVRKAAALQARLIRKQLEFQSESVCRMASNPKPRRLT